MSILDINQNLFNVDNIEQLTKTSCNELLEQINLEDAINNKNKILILNYILLTYIKKENKALSVLKREKLFLLNIDSKNKLLIKILDFLLANCDAFSLISADKKYFESKRNLAYLSDDIYILSSEIRKIIKNYGKTFIRDILYIADFLAYKKMSNIESASGITNEILTEACSFLIYLYLKINNEHNISQKTFSYIESLNNKQLNILINNTIKIKQFQDAEKLIDNFDYICLRENNKIIIKNEDSLFERSRIYGDVHSNMQRFVDAFKNAKNYCKNGALSFDDFIELVFDRSKALFEFVENPVRRYIFKMSYEINKVIQREEYFLNEIIELEEIKKEYLLDDVMNFKIASTLTLKDITMIKRIFAIIGKLNSKFLFSILKDDKNKKQAVYNSWIKVFRYDELKNLLASCVGGDKAEEFISEFAWSLNSNSKLDLQFTPFVKSTDYYIPMNILISSNLFRNSLFKNKIRPHDTHNTDLISQCICNLLKINFRFVEKEVRFQHSNYHGDFDVIAYIDDIVYVFECKNIITPADLHELRTTYTDNIKKGFTQLEKAKKALADHNFIGYMNERLRWNLPTTPKVVTCLVLGSRMFNGYTYDNHHIRAFHELYNFLKSGKIEINYKGKPERINLWSGESIAGADIFNFIEKRILHKPLFDSFIPIYSAVNFKKFNLFFETFEFNEENFIDKIKEMQTV
jgi:hypothetical protein